MGTQLTLPKGAQPSTPILAHICCGQMAALMKMSLAMEVGLSPGDFVLHEDPAPPPQKGAEPASPIFGPFLLWPNGWMHQDTTWHRGRPQPRGLCVRWGPSPHLPKKGPEPVPKFLAHVYCGQTAGWIKMALDTEVGLSPGDFLLAGSQLPSPKRGQSPQLSAHFCCGQGRQVVLGRRVSVSVEHLRAV